VNYAQPSADAHHPQEFRSHGVYTGHNIKSNRIDDDDWDLDEPVNARPAAGNSFKANNLAAAAQPNRPMAAAGATDDLDDDFDQFLEECGTGTLPS